ncbi:MurG-like transferase [Phycisphaerae bacterium RAS1]|nr:MurG-like transferase [Phycisphaerae bacterium RAS1]
MFVWISTGGSHGDVHPFLALGQTMQRRGHRVVLCVHPHFRDDVLAAGLEHSPIGEHVDVPAILNDPDLMHHRRGGGRVLDLILGSVPAGLRTLRDAWRNDRPDVVVAHHICIGVRWVCNELHIPLALCTLAPLLWFSPRDPVPVFQRRHGRAAAAIARAMLPCVKPLASWIVGRRVNRIRRQCGVAAERNAFWADMHGGDALLGLWSPHYRAPTTADPPRSLVCGFTWYDRSDREPMLPPELERFLSRGQPPIVFSLGTAAVYHPGDYYHIAAETCQRLGRRGVLLVGKDANAPPDLPADILPVHYAPFSLLLPRAAAVVQHGGIGSTAQSLRAGCPQVVVPHAHDQFHNALHVRRLGVGLNTPRVGLNARKLAAALAPVASDPAFRRHADRLAGLLRNEDGARVASEAVEKLVADSAARRGGA